MALDFLAGCLGGCAGVIVGHPFDTIKVRLQTQDGSSPKYKGSVDCLRSILKTEKVHGLFRGMSSPMAGVAVVNAVVFGVYGNAQKQLGNSVWAHGACGVLAGSVQSLISSPVELAKTRLQVQGLQGGGGRYTGPLDCLRQLQRAEGYRAIFRGFGSTVLRDAPAFGIYFASYEQLVRHGTGGPLHLMAAGGLAGVLSWLFSYPCDVVKSRLQVDGMTGPRKYAGFWDCAVKSYRSEGTAAFTRGLNSTLVRAFPTNAAIFAVVTWVLRTFDPNVAPSQLQQALHHQQHHHRQAQPLHLDPELHLSRVAGLIDFHF